MKRLLFKMVMVVVIVAGATNYMIYLKTGRMPLREWVASLKDMRAPSANELMDKARDVAPIGDKKVKIYTWKDEYGQVHYSNQEEKAAKGAQEKMVSTKINTMPAVKPQPRPASAEEGAAPSAGVETSDMEESLRRLREAKKAQFESQLE